MKTPGSQYTASGGRSGHPGETGLPLMIRSHSQATRGAMIQATLRRRRRRWRSLVI